jgi:hypothetical protein
VARGLGLRLVDEQLDLVDLGLEDGGLGDEPPRELLQGQGDGSDLSPPAS